MNITQIFKNKRHATAISVGILLVLIIATRTIGNANADEATTINNPEQKVVALLDVQALRSTEKTIATTGEVESLAQVELRSEVFGKISYVAVSLGDKVYQGQTIASMSNGDLAAQRAQAQADVDRAIVTKEQLKAQYDAGVANHEKILVSTQNAIASAEAAVETAANNVRLNENTAESEIVRDAYENSIPTLNAALVTIQGVLQTSDNLLGVDSNLANQDFEKELSIADVTKKTDAEMSYIRTKRMFETAQESVKRATPVDTTTVDAALSNIDALLAQAKIHVTDMQAVIDATLPLGKITQTLLDTFRAHIATSQTSVNGSMSAVNTNKQAIDTAKNSLSSYQIAYEKSLRDLAATQAQAHADVRASQSQVTQLEASIRSQDTQIARAEAVVRGINASIGKTIVRTPISGTVAVLPAKTGEIAQNGALIASIVNTDGMQIKTYIDSRDLVGIRVGNIAYMDGTPVGTITHVAPSIDPATKKVEVHVAVNDDAKPHLVIGQFVDIDLAQIQENETEEMTSLLLPLTAVRIDPEKRSVFVVNDTHVVESREVEINRIIGDKIEVTSGLETIDTILISTRGIDVGDAVTIAE